MRATPHDRSDRPAAVQGHFAFRYETLLDAGIHAQREFERQAETGDIGLDVKLAEQSDDLMRERISVLRRLEKLTTLDDALATLGEGEEASDYYLAEECRRLATTSGYEFEDQSVIGFVLRRNGVELLVGLQQLPAADGVLEGRITELSAGRNNYASPRAINYREAEWQHRCTDAVVQHEIDRVLAIFGGIHPAIPSSDNPADSRDDVEADTADDSRGASRDHHADALDDVLRGEPRLPTIKRSLADETNRAVRELATRPDLIAVASSYLRAEDERLRQEERALTKQLTDLGVLLPRDAECRELLDALRGVMDADDLAALDAAFNDVETNHKPPLAGRAQGLFARFYDTRSDDYMWGVERAITDWSAATAQRMQRGLDAHPEAVPLYGRLMGIQALRKGLDAELEAVMSRGE